MYDGVEVGHDLGHLVEPRPQHSRQVEFDVASQEYRIDRQPGLTRSREYLIGVQVAVDRQL
jgi:hypothetical protein